MKEKTVENHQYRVMNREITAKNHQYRVMNSQEVQRFTIGDGVREFSFFRCSGRDLYNGKETAVAMVFVENYKVKQLENYYTELILFL